MHRHDHLVNHIHHSELVSDNTLHVIGVLTNPMRFHSRLRLFREWYEEMMATPNVKVYVVECAYGDRHHEVTEHGNPQHLQLRSHQPIWLKENLINLAVKRLLPHNWRYMSWSDTDVFFMNKHWAQEALHIMQDYCVIQPWTDCIDLGFEGDVLQHFKSFCYQDRKGVPKQCVPTDPYEYAHTGYIWCCRRDFWEAIGGLIDWSVLGSADHHMAWGLINKIEYSVHQKTHNNFLKLAEEWQYRAFRHCHGHLGFVKGRIEHRFHGPKNRGTKGGRQYRERWQIPITFDFDPIRDVTYDPQGVIRVDGKPGMIEACRNYMINRLEDSIENY